MQTLFADAVQIAIGTPGAVLSGTETEDPVQTIP